MVTTALLTLPALRARSGLGEMAQTGFVEVEGDACAPPSLTWYPLVRLQSDGTAALVAGRGSGDWIAAARSDGFVEVPPGQIARGVRCYIPWND
jgi:molybdopterin biosynthesis enzyme